MSGCTPSRARLPARCAVAARVGAELIVVGNRGVDARFSRLRPAIAERVRHHAPCAVLVVDTEAYWRPVSAVDERRGRIPREWQILLVTTVAVFMAFLDDAVFLVAARVVQAIGAAALIPTSLALVLPEFPPERRAVATSVWAAAGAVAAATGPSLGGVLVDAGGWRWAFLVNVVVALGVLPARRLLVDRTDPAGADPPDLLGGALLAGAVGALALGIVKAPDWGWTDDRVLAAWIGTVLALAMLAVGTRHHPAPVLEPALLRIRSFAVGNTAMLVLSMGFYALLLANVLFLTQVWGYSVLEAGSGAACCARRTAPATT